MLSCQCPAPNAAFSVPDFCRASVFSRAGFLKHAQLCQQCEQLSQCPAPAVCTTFHAPSACSTGSSSSSAWLLRHGQISLSLAPTAKDIFPASAACLVVSYPSTPSVISVKRHTGNAPMHHKLPWMIFSGIFQQVPRCRTSLLTASTGILGDRFLAWSTCLALQWILHFPVPSLDLSSGSSEKASFLGMLYQPSGGCYSFHLHPTLLGDLFASG